MTDTDLLALSVLIVLLLILSGIGRLRSGRRFRRRPREDKQRPKGPALILDGSNVMHWRNETPDIATVRSVVSQLGASGYNVGVVFDANAGYLLEDAYQNHEVLAKQLGLPNSHVHVVPKGTPADPMILTAARDMRARVVTNDKFRDWSNDFPEVAQPGFLITGGYGRDGFWLNLDRDDASA